MELKGLNMLRRRLWQMGSLLFGKTASSLEQLSIGVSQRYSEKKELAFYRQWRDKGPFEFEQELLANLGKEAFKGTRVLVVGCGTGRECVFFAKLGAEVFGVDINPDMIDLANELDTTQTHHYAVLPSTGNAQNLPIEWPMFDWIYLTWGLPSHIPSQVARISWLKSWQAKLLQTGSLILFPEICDFSSTLNRFSLGHWVVSLRARYHGYSWEEGDTMRSFFGNHNPSPHLAYYHYYPSLEEVWRELKAASFTGDFATEFSLRLRAI